MTPVCKRCGSPKIPPAGLKRRRYVCSKCLNATPAGKAARRAYMRRYRKTAAGRVYRARQIRYGLDGHYFGLAQTPEQAAQVKAHIRARVQSFKEQQRVTLTGLQTGTQAQSHSDGAMATEAAARND
jgi:hypothetical protein